MTPEERALLTLTIVCADADMIGGGHYSPDLRDCLHDAAKWVGPIIAVAIREAENAVLKDCANTIQSAQAAARSSAFEEAAKVAESLMSQRHMSFEIPMGGGDIIDKGFRYVTEEGKKIASAIRDLKTKGE